MFEIIVVYVWWTVLARAWRGYAAHVLLVACYGVAFYDWYPGNNKGLVTPLVLIGCLIVFAVGWPRLVKIQRQQRAELQDLSAK